MNAVSECGLLYGEYVREIGSRGAEKVGILPPLLTERSSSSDAVSSRVYPVTGLTCCPELSKAYLKRGGERWRTRNGKGRQGR